MDKQNTQRPKHYKINKLKRNETRRNGMEWNRTMTEPKNKPYGFPKITKNINTM